MSTDGIVSALSTATQSGAITLPEESGPLNL